MTFREQIAQRVLVIRCVLFVGIGLAIVPTIVLGQIHPIWRYVGQLVMLVTTATAMLSARLKCPRCSANMFDAVSKAVFGTVIIASCPHCGANLDEPMPL